MEFDDEHGLPFLIINFEFVTKIRRNFDLIIVISFENNNYSEKHKITFKNIEDFD